MPITSPSRFTSGPPLLPGLMAASVWMKLACTLRSRPRPLALIMPAVTVPSSLKGIAQGEHPVAHLHVVAVAQFDRRQRVAILDANDGQIGLRVRLMSVASNSRPSCSVTVILPPPSTTWLFVRMIPERIDDDAGAHAMNFAMGHSMGHVRHLEEVTKLRRQHVAKRVLSGRLVAFVLVLRLLGVHRPVLDRHHGRQHLLRDFSEGRRERPGITHPMFRLGTGGGRTPVLGRRRDLLPLNSSDRTPTNAKRQNPQPTSALAIHNNYGS